MPRKAIIIGAGPAGLTAAYELLTRTDIKPVILEKSGDIGGISKTVNYKGNRIDIGGHRFFSKSDRVMQWWMHIMPVEPLETKEYTVTYQRHRRTIKAEEVVAAEHPGTDSELRMLIRNRLSRIYFLRKFFSYPIQLSYDTLKKLGLGKTIGIIASYIKARLFPRKPEASLEDFFINRFGSSLYQLFFKDYTEKVWGVPCTKISAEWGAQRIKGISIGKAIAHAMRSLKPSKMAESGDIGQKKLETSLIERFLYPKLGPGQLWEEVARQVQEMGGEIHLHQQVKKIRTIEGRITAVEVTEAGHDEIVAYGGDYFFSSMPVQELIAGMDGVPAAVSEVAAGLQYRDFITVGVLLKKTACPLPDTWIYIQEREVKVGRMQIFNNWSPFMVKDPDTVWLGMEYFCNQSDAFWAQDDSSIQATAIAELEQMGLASTDDVLDCTVIRMEKTYPAYFGTYERFDEIRQFTDKIANLFLVGRNGMHKYNNSDHSMLTAMVAVDNIFIGSVSKANLWTINTEQTYHEEQTGKPISKVPKLANPLWDFVWNNRINRAWLIVGLSVMVVQFILFKVNYPFANYLPDSYVYLDAAATNADVNMWPVAYSKFLRQISVYSHSDLVVVAVQYFFMQISGLVFLFSLFYLVRPAKWVRSGLLLFFFFDPAILYMSNYISADSLFIGFSFLWISSLLWIIAKPSPWQAVAQAVLLLVCFTLRYNAIYYPLIAAFGFLISKYRWYGKMAGIGLGFVLVGISIVFTTKKMKEVTGEAQFSPFGGWQLANNALYMYQDIPAGDRKPVPRRFASLEGMVQQHMDTLKRIQFTREDSVAAHFYLWSPKGPLIQYMARKWKKDSTTPLFKRWAVEGPLYADYGAYLIKQYPVDYLKSFVLPNALRFAIPPTEFLGIYNMGGDSVGRLAKEWFNYRSPRVSKNNSLKIHTPIMTSWSMLATLINTLFLISIAGLFMFKGLQPSGGLLPKVVLLLSLLWVVNSGFSIFASPIALRYQLFPVLASLGITLPVLQRIYELAAHEDRTKKIVVT